MDIIVNGETWEIEPAITVQELLISLGFESDRVVVELNRQILTSSSFAVIHLDDGDAVEVIQFVGGG
jgi:thiamine biosynthesis protein ThiS